MEKQKIILPAIKRSDLAAVFVCLKEEVIKSQGLESPLSNEHIRLIRVYKNLKFLGNNNPPSMFYFLGKVNVSLRKFVELFPNKEESLEALSPYVY